MTAPHKQWPKAGCVTASPWRELPVWFNVEGHSLLGLLTLPAPGIAPQCALVIAVGGPQYRVGSHRQFVKVARSMAAMGMAVLRFDVRGMGDSAGVPRRFTELDDDLAGAVQALRSACPSVERVNLFGLCDGASAALMFLRRRPDVPIHQVVLLNPWVRHETTLATTQLRYYYARRLLQWSLWRQVLSGGLSLTSLREFLSSVCTAALSRLRGPHRAAASADFREIMRQGLIGKPRAALIILSENDFVAREFRDLCSSDPDWRQLLDQSGAQWIEITGADHTLSQRHCEARMIESLVEFFELSAG